MGRDMVYDATTCDMLLAASSHELYRLNLDRGQFLAPLATSASAVNCVRVSPLHGLYGLACDNAAVEFWDRRDRRRLGALQIARTPSYTGAEEALEVTALHFMPDGLHWAAGTSDGRVLLFDLRSHQPLDIRDHYNGYAIKKIDYHEARNMLVSTDKRTIKLWQRTEHSSTRSLFTAIESESEINDFILQPGTGLVLAANDASPIASYFIPALGPAPRWCAFLENLTEEMEERGGDQANAVYENFKFITRGELAQLGLDHLIGTNLLRAYMHGYFIDLRLYEKAKAIANPFAYEEYLAKKRQAKLDRERQSRIRARDPVRTAKVNKQLAAKLLRDQQASLSEDEGEDEGEAEAGSTRVPSSSQQSSKAAKTKRRTKETATAILQDDRFASLFADPDFEIDQDSAEYQALHPAAFKADRRKPGAR